jgi:hypothetical protein
MAGDSDLNHDLTDLLAQWDYDPNTVTARFVDGADGRVRIQLRMDLGVFQMEPDDRPDGQRPHGFPTALDYYRTLARTTRPGRLTLDGEACAELQLESVQFYYRYLARMQLKDYAGVMADTGHNLAIFDLVAEHAEEEDLVWDFLQFKPYVIMMHTRALAMSRAAREDYLGAAEATRQGIAQIETFWRDREEEDLARDNLELDTLRELLEGFEQNRPRTEVDDLRDELSAAIRNENFEKAAVLRDRLREIERAPAPAAGG